MADQGNASGKKRTATVARTVAPVSIQEQLNNANIDLVAAQQQSAQLQQQVDTCNTDLAAARQQVIDVNAAAVAHVQQLEADNKKYLTEVDSDGVPYEENELAEKYYDALNFPQDEDGKTPRPENKIAVQQTLEIKACEAKLTELPGLKAEVQQLRSQVQQLPTLQAQVQQLQAQSQSNQDLQAAYSQCQSDLERLNIELSARIEELQNTTEQLDACSRDYSRLEQEIDDFRKKEDSLNAEHQGKLDEINRNHQVKLNELEGHKSEMVNYLQELQRENDDFKLKLNDAEDSRNFAISQAKARLQQDLKALQSSHDALVVEIEQKQAEVEETLGKHDDCEARFKKCEMNLKACNDKVRSKDIQLSDLEKKLRGEKDQLRQQFEDLQSRFEELQTEKDRLQTQFAENIFGDIGLGSDLASGLGAAPIVRQMTPAQQVDSAFNAYASGYAREMDTYSAMARDIIGNAVQENSEYIASNEDMKKWQEECKAARLKGEEELPLVSYTVANPAKPFTQYETAKELLEIFQENNCFTCWRNIRANIDGREMPWTIGISGALTIADLLIRSIDYTFMILTSTKFTGVFTDTAKYPSINEFITQKKTLYKVAFATAQSRDSLESVEVKKLVTLVVLSLSEMIYATYKYPSDCKENLGAQKLVEGEIDTKVDEKEGDKKAKGSKDKKKNAKEEAAKKAAAEAAKKTPGRNAKPPPKAGSGKAKPAPAPPPLSAAAGSQLPGVRDAEDITPLIFETVKLMSKFLSTKSLLDVSIAAVLFKFMKCALNKGFAFFTYDHSAANDAALRGVPTYSQLSFPVGEATTLSGGKISDYKSKRVFCIDDTAIAGYLWIVKNATAEFEKNKLTNPGLTMIQFLNIPDSPLGQRDFFIFKEIYFMGDATKQNPLVYSTIYDDATSLSSDGPTSRAFSLMLDKNMPNGGPKIYDILKEIGNTGIGYGFDADLYKCSTISRLMFNKKFGKMQTSGEFQKYITMNTLDYMRHDYKGLSVRYFLLGLNLMRKIRTYNSVKIPSIPFQEDDYDYDYSSITGLQGAQVSQLMNVLQEDLTDSEKVTIQSMNTDIQTFNRYLDKYKAAITPAGIFYWPLHPSLIPEPGNDQNNAKKMLFNTYLFMAAKSVDDYENGLFTGNLHIYGIASKGTPRVWLAGASKLSLSNAQQNVAFLEYLMLCNIILANTPIPQYECGVVDLQLTLSSINTQGKSVIGVDATQEADGNSGTSEDPRYTTVVGYLQPTKGFVNGVQICTINSGSNSTGEVYSPIDTSDIDFLYGKMLYSILKNDILITAPTAINVVSMLSGFSEDVTSETSKITLVEPLPFAAGVEVVKKNIAVVLDDIDIKAVDVKTPAVEAQGSEVEMAGEGPMYEAVVKFKDVVDSELSKFSGVFKPYKEDYPKKKEKGKDKLWPVGGVADTFIKIIQTNLRPLVTNINTAYTSMLLAFTTMTYSATLMTINAAVNTIFGILYTNLTSQVQVFQKEQEALMAEPDVKIRVSTREKAATKGPAASNPIAYTPFQGLEIPIFPVDALVMASGGGVNNDSHSKGKPKNKDTRSFKVKSDKKTSRKNK